MNIENFKNLSLKKFLCDYNVCKQAFDYAGFTGKAELCSYKIVLFRKGDDRDTVAINLSEIEDKKIIDLTNNIISYIDIGVKFGDRIDVIKDIYGEPFSTDDDLVDTIRYNYLCSPDLFICFGIKKNKLAYLEIVNDYEIVSEIVKIR